MFAKALYLKHYGYLLDDPDIFQIFFPGTYRSTRELKHNDVIVISGKKGSGKTELAKFMAYVYHEKLPRNRVIVFSGIKDLYNDLPWAVKVDLKEVEQEEQEKSRGDYSGVPDASEFRDSLVIFDDTEKMPNAKIEKMLYQLANVLAQNGRNFGTNVICILHQVNKGLQSTTLLREADTFIIFPKSYDRNTFNTLIHHLGFSKEDAQALYAQKDEWFILIHQTIPSYVYLGTSMKKINL
jgi:energy-coupling factor transporter ATP-binding protein EcfA2